MVHPFQQVLHLELIPLFLLKLNSAVIALNLAIGYSECDCDFNSQQKFLALLFVLVFDFFLYLNWMMTHLQLNFSFCLAEHSLFSTALFIFSFYRYF